MRRDGGLTLGEIHFVLVSALYTLLLALLHFGIAVGTVRGLQWLWNSAVIGSTGIPRISGRLTAALLIPLLLCLAIRPGEFLSRPRRGDT